MTTACCDPTFSSPTAGACACGEPVDPAVEPAERNRYFTGKYMTARDFRDEQGFFLARQRLHQRVLHGSGIVCGLNVAPHPDPNCRAKGWVVVSPGIAVDCHGRDIVVREQLAVNVPRLYPHTVACGDEAKATEPTPTTDGEKKKESQSPGEGPLPKDPPKAGDQFLIGVRFGELCVEPVPVLVDETGCGERRTPNRIREVAAVRYRTCGSKGCGAADGWGPKPGPCHCPASPDPAPPLPASLAEVLAPLCTCGADDVGFVPLASCTFSGEGAVAIDETGRRYLDGPLNPDQLTRICRTNWNHGESMWLDDAGFVNRNDGKSNLANAHCARGHLRLAVQFNGPLDRKSWTELGARGPRCAYRRIFQVRYESSEGELLPLPGEATYALSDDATVLSYEVPLHCLGRLRSPLAIHVLLNCDFLTDSRGRAVDGNHLKGRLAWDDCGHPKGSSGDGVEGGAFESWFELNWQTGGHHGA